ncbi:MAG: ABC transporter ATP-binding protein, partial [Deltaproteobacteria bacterium]|nr:ABC transporter ATP-binding protein [Deltaproteobacteria bacterium]
MSFLSINRLTKRFGGLTAVDNLDINIEKGQVLGLIGPNGAGKSTAFNCVAGAYPPTSGRVLFKDENIEGFKPWTICARGIARTFQIVKPLQTRTVLFNVMVGAFCRTESKKKATEISIEVLEFLGLLGKQEILGKNLTIGDRKRLELARALATGPELLLMDEVMAGLRPSEVDEMIGIVRKIRDRGVTIFLIEHIMQAIMNLSDRVVVIHYGKKIAEGSPKEVSKEEKAIKA